jgi:hypothetical protein
MKDIFLGIIYILIATWLLLINKVSLGYMSPNFEGIPKYLFIGILILFGLLQIKSGYKKNNKDLK